MNLKQLTKIELIRELEATRDLWKQEQMEKEKLQKVNDELLEKLCETLEKLNKLKGVKENDIQSQKGKTNKRRNVVPRHRAGRQGSN